MFSTNGWQLIIKGILGVAMQMMAWYIVNPTMKQTQYSARLDKGLMNVVWKSIQRKQRLCIAKIPKGNRNIPLMSLSFWDLPLLAGQQTASIEEVTASIQELDTMIKTLSESIKVFKV